MIDCCVKLNEIEACIMKIKGVKAAVIKELKRENEEKFLCLYYTSEDIEIKELQCYLLDTLPDYLIPSDIIKLQELPRNSKGEMDDTKLPKPFSLQSSIDKQKDESLSGVEEKNDLLFDNRLEQTQEVETLGKAAKHNKEAKELKIAMQRDITVYLHRSLPLCIALSDSRFLPWYYNKFIQIYSHTDGSGFVYLNYLEHYDNISEISNFVCLGMHLLEYIPSIIDFVIQNINEGYYLIVNLDESLLSNKVSYGKEHFIHESLIYGYDNTTKSLKAIGFDNNNIFTQINFEYDTFVKAYESAKKHYKETAPWCQWSALRMVGLKDFDGEYPFSIEKFADELGKYLFSNEDMGMIYCLEHKGGHYNFGISVYDVYIDGMKKLLQGVIAVDYRATHLLAEHQKCLYDRLVFIMSSYDVSNEFKELCKRFSDIIKEFDKIRLKIYSQFSKDEVSNALTVDLENQITDVINKIEEFKKEEELILSGVYREILKIEH